MLSHKRRIPRHTVLPVGEGTTEWAFLKHIKSLYTSRGCGVSATIRNAHGKGPNHVMDYAIRQCRNADYDRVVTLLDTDLEMSVVMRRRAMAKKIQTIGSTPRIEGLLLKILGKHVPGTSAECKARCGGTFATRLTLPEDYRAHFPRDVLDRRQAEVPELGRLLDCLLFDE